MANLKLLPSSILLLFFLFLLPISSYTATICPLSICGNNTFTIRFPFQLQSQDSQNCSYPGFELRCKDEASKVLINIPQLGDFFVNEINYVSQSILIRDPGDCLPGRFLNTFDTSSSPFSVAYVNYTFVSCLRDPNTTSRFVVVECLSNSTRSVLAIPSGSAEDLKSLESCEKIAGDLPVPSSWPEGGGGSLGFNNEVQLKWDVPDCRDCVARGEVCGFQSNNSLQVECSVDPIPIPDTDHKRGPTGLTIFRIIALSIAVPAFALSVCIGVFLCFVDTRRANRRRNIPENGGATYPSNAVATGLDQSTIDTYTKVVLGESRRVPGLNDGTCPICLSDYNAKEALRCIPECQHCFHAECLDEWLRLNGTCPICRTLPPREDVD